MPTNEQLQSILTDLAVAQRAFHVSLAALQAVLTAQGNAIEAVIAATNKALLAFDGRQQ